MIRHRVGEGRCRKGARFGIKYTKIYKNIQNDKRTVTVNIKRQTVYMSFLDKINVNLVAIYATFMKIFEGKHRVVKYIRNSKSSF